jgi:hypothetical protein
MTSPQQPDAVALQTVLGSIGTLTVSQLVELFNTYSATDGFTDLLRTAVPEIVGQHAQAAATVTAQWYDELKPGSTFHATPVVDLPAERMQKSIGWALHAPGPKTLQPAPGQPAGGLTAMTETQDPATALSRLAGSAKRMVYDAGRDTIVQNAAAEDVGWARYAQPDACAFCRVLATRSADSLYMTEHSAQFVVGRARKTRGKRKMGEKYHDHCRCVPFPIRSGDYDPPNYTQLWQEQYEDARNDGNSTLKAILAHMRANSDAH